jgi:hypothetical protein
MDIKTKFSCGDKAWTFSGSHSEEMTIGSIEVTVTNSAGDDGQMFDNYKSQSGYVEKYMCTETGIGSGSVYTLNEHIFGTKEECDVANAEWIAKRKAEQDAERVYQRNMLIEEEAEVLRKLDRINEAKRQAESEAIAP